MGAEDIKAAGSTVIDTNSLPIGSDAIVGVADRSGVSSDVVSVRVSDNSSDGPCDSACAGASAGVVGAVAANTGTSVTGIDPGGDVALSGSAGDACS